MKPETSNDKPETPTAVDSSDGLGIYIVAVVVWVKHSAKHWWQDSTSSWLLTQHKVTAASGEIAEAIAASKALKVQDERYPTDSKEIRQMTWHRIKDA